MPNVTLSLDEDLIKKGRKYAQKRGTSFNSLIRELLARELEQQDKNWLDNVFNLMDKANASSDGKKWLREDLYER